MNDSSTQQAMRDMRRVLANPRAFAGLGLAAVLVTIIQPFGLRVPGPIGLTLMYWLLMIAVTFPLGFVISAACMAVCRQRWCAAVMAACAMAIAVAISTYTLNIMFLGWDIGEVENWRLLAVTAGPVAALITVLIHIVQAPTATVADPTQSPKAPASPALLNHLRPKWAIITAGLNNAFQHPHPEIVSRYQNRGARLMSTAEEGALIFRADREGLHWVSSARPARQKFWSD